MATPLLAPAPHTNLRCWLVAAIVAIGLHHRVALVALYRYFHHYLYCRSRVVVSCSSPKLSLMVIHCRLFLRICQGVCWVIDRMRSRYRDIYLRHITLTQFLIIHPLPQKDPAREVNTKTHLPIEYKQRSVRFWQGQEYSHRTVVKPKVAFCRKIPHSSLSAHGIMAIR